MNKKIPKIFVNKLNKINNKTVFYSVKDDYKETNPIDIQNKINDIFKSKDFIYKKKLHIKTNEYDKDFIIVSKSIDYLLTIDGSRIYIKEILEIY